MSQSCPISPPLARAVLLTPAPLRCSNPDLLPPCVLPGFAGLPSNSEEPQPQAPAQPTPQPSQPAEGAAAVPATLSLPQAYLL